MLAITPADCGDGCFFAQGAVPLVAFASAFLAFAVAAWIAGWGLRCGVEPPAREGLSRADALLAAQDALLIGLLGVAVARGVGLTLVALPSSAWVPGEAVEIASAWVGFFLLLLGLRSRAPTPAPRFWPGLAAILVAPMFVVIGTAAVRCALTGRHPGPCVANVPLDLWHLVGVGLVFGAAGSVFARMRAYVVQAPR